MDTPIEAGYPTSDPAAFRRCLGQFATGVTVIATRVGDTLAAMTSNSFSSVSLEPPLILWSIKRHSQSFPLFEASHFFTVNILADDQIELSKIFAKSGPDKFNGVAWTPGVEGVPVLDGAVASFECRKTTVVDGGDHLIIIGLVERYCRYDRQPLLFAQGRYAIVADYPQSESLDGMDVEGAGQSVADRLTTSLFIKAYGAMVNVMETARRRGGVSLQESILLRAVKTMPGRTLDQLLPEMLLGMNAGQSVFRQLRARGLVTTDSLGRLELTAEGTERINAVIQFSWEIEKETFRQIPAADIAATRRVLKTLIETHSH